MELIADIFLIAGALGAGLYCVVLSRRLNRFNDVERGVGGAIAVLSKQVSDMTNALETAQKATASSASSLSGLTNKAEGVAQRLELLVASMHDLPDPHAFRAAGEDGDDDVVTVFQSRRAPTQEAAE